MAGKRSFGVAVWREYQDDIDTAVSEYVEENLANIGLRTRRVSNPTEAIVGQLNYQRAIAYDTPGTVVMFDLVISAEIEFFGVSHSQSVEDEDSKWFRLSCEVCLDDGLHDFKISSIEPYDHTSNKWQGTLSDTLVPIISTAELDKQAEKMLRDVYPEALMRPTRIDVREFARRLELTVEEKRLSRTSTIFGEMILSDCTIDYIDDYAKGYKHLDVPKGTILVDPEVYFLRTIGSWNNTVIHECVHWQTAQKLKNSREIKRVYAVFRHHFGLKSEFLRSLYLGALIKREIAFNRSARKCADVLQSKLISAIALKVSLRKKSI